MNAVITRLAPSPTGNLHLGGVRTALINYIVAKKAKKKFPESKFLIRIEDTDKIRSNNEFKNNIIDELSWMGFHHDDELHIVYDGESPADYPGDNNHFSFSLPPGYHGE